MKSLIPPLALGLAVAGVLGAQGNSHRPVIVVFQDNVRFQDFAPFNVRDDRDSAQPHAWGYLDRGVAGAVRYQERRRGFRADHVFSHALRGFAARLSADQVRELENDSMVKHVEPDGVMSVTAQTVPWGISQIGANLSSAVAGDGGGAIPNVRVYIIDTGVSNHADLNRVAQVNFAGGKNDDCNGHGTHVAGTVAAKDDSADVVGVVPGAPVIGVKVLGCNGSGSTSGVIKGIDWVTANRQLPAVANMSLGGRQSDAMDEAVRRSAASGVFYSVSAGNNGTDACTGSPARAGAGADNGIVTTAATDPTNDDPYWSNWGTCVDLWAPGTSVLSTKLGGGTTTLSGTSMSSPHVAGTAALYLASQPAASAAAVEAQLKATAMSTGKLAHDGRPIKLVYARFY